MSSSTGQSKIENRTADLMHDDSVRSISVRLIWISVTSLISWGVILAILFASSLPPLSPRPEGLAIDKPPVESIRIAAGILIAHFLSVVLVQLSAPRTVIRSRLISNTMFGGLLLSLCASITLVTGILPPDTVTYFKSALVIAFQPAFVIANFLLCAVCGLGIYWARESRIVDMVEIYWSLGLMLLLGLSIALVMAIVQV